MTTNNDNKEELEIMEPSKVKITKSDENLEEKNKKSKITLTEEKETLLITLISKAEDAKLPESKSILSDKKALEVMNGIDYDFDRVRIKGALKVGSRIFALRAKGFDSLLTKYVNLIKSERNCGSDKVCVVHIGCGLDGRYDRFGDDKIKWYDLDFPEVVDIRKNFFKNTENYKQIASDANNFSWVKTILNDDNCKDCSFIFISEGCFPYIAPEDVKKLVLKIHENFPDSFLIFDSGSTKKQKGINKNFSQLKKTGAKLKFALDNQNLLTKWNQKITILEDWTFWDKPEYYKKLGSCLSCAMWMAKCFENLCFCCCKNVMRSSFRVNVYRL